MTKKKASNRACSSEAVPRRKDHLKSQALHRPLHQAVSVPSVPSLSRSRSQPTNCQVHTLLDGYVWTINNFLLPSECRDWIRYMDASPTVTMIQRGTSSVAARSCTRYQFDNGYVAQELYDRLQQALQKSTINLSTMIGGDADKKQQSTPVGCNPNIRLYRYAPGQSFGLHYDDSVQLSTGTTRLTLLVYLSSCQGGATSFVPPPPSMSTTKLRRCVAYEPVTAGTCLLHVHGPDCLLHQGEAVTGGAKYVLRSDVVYK